jgi:cell wall assembly regulator SMI1
VIVVDCDVSLTPEDVDRVEAKLALKLPAALRAHYLRWNGGTPEPWVFKGASHTEVVSELLPLQTEEDADTAVDVYRDLVVRKRLVPTTLFPFAVDPGGDYFFVDVGTPDGQVFIYRHDTAFENLRALDHGFDAFLAALVDEEP